MLNSIRPNTEAHPIHITHFWHRVFLVLGTLSLAIYGRLAFYFGAIHRGTIAQPPKEIWRLVIGGSMLSLFCVVLFLHVLGVLVWWLNYRILTWPDAALTQRLEKQLRALVFLETSKKAAGIYHPHSVQERTPFWLWTPEENMAYRFSPSAMRVQFSLASVIFTIFFTLVLFGVGE